MKTAHFGVPFFLSQNVESCLDQLESARAMNAHHQRISRPREIALDSLIPSARTTYKSMTKLDINAPEEQRETGTISKADRYALLKMLDEKPSAVIDGALRSAASRGIFTDKLVSYGQSDSKSFSGSILKPVLIAGVLLSLGAIAYFGTRGNFAIFQEPRSVIGLTPDDLAKIAAKEGGEKYEVVLPRLSENVRNVVKNYVSATGTNTNPEANCAAIAKQNISGKAAPAQRPTESADAWIKRMNALKTAGKIYETQVELSKFRQVYPFVALPAALQALVC
jgi:hypothetical protein